ncbi:hypothetical protein PMAYCL1PPCAC_32958, partial [Pristionchus mayeri]
VSAKLMWNACIIVVSLARYSICKTWATICFSFSLSIICFSFDRRRSIDALYALSIRRRIPSDLKVLAQLFSETHLMSIFFALCRRLSSSSCRLELPMFPRVEYTLRSSFKISERLLRAAAVSSSLSVTSVSQKAKAISAMNSTLSGLIRLYSSLIVRLNSKFGASDLHGKSEKCTNSIQKY